LLQPGWVVTMLTRWTVKVVAVAICWAAVAIGSSQPVAAWEEDVHYVLTFWLASQSGFSRSDADQIARGNQSYDDSEHRAAISTVIWIVLRGDIGAARELQLKHFPNDASLPSPPLRRVVVPNSPSARQPVEAAMAAATSATFLTTFGEALHPFHDSWSHQGVPDIPFNLKRDLISAHPQARGGWRSHNADLTHLHVSETIELARETYGIFTQFLNQNPRFRQNASPPWAKLEPLVRAFAAARTPEEKATWATRNVPEEQGRLLRRAQAAGAQLRIRAVGPPLTNRRSAIATLDAHERAALLQAVNDFLRVWLVQGRVESALAYVDMTQLRLQFTDSEQLTTTSAVEAWAARFLTIQLIDDHMAVNTAGHGDPLAPGYKDLPLRPADAGAYKATRRAEAASISGRELVATDLLDGPAFALVLLNEDVLQDALTIVWKRVGDKWLAVRLLSLPH
jgi:hypothetical protein